MFNEEVCTGKYKVDIKKNIYRMNFFYLYRKHITHNYHVQ